jgi:hypothetical protein
MKLPIYLKNIFVVALHLLIDLLFQQDIKKPFLKGLFTEI